MSRNSFPMKAVFSAPNVMVVQNITTGAASVKATNAVGLQTYAVQLACTANAWILIADTSAGAVATATNSFLLLANGPSIQMGISPGQFIAALQVTATGTVNILELTH